VKNKRFCYRQGVILTETHATLLKGQVVQIIEEDGSDYLVRVNINSPVFVLNKQDVLVN
jgi:hypothetical protein